MSVRDLAVDLLDCSKCGQPAGVNCKTSGGFWANWPHAARLNPIWEAWRRGVTDGSADVVRAIDENQPGEPHANPTWLEGYLERIRKEAAADA